MIDHKLSLDFSDHESLKIGIISDTHGKLDAGIAQFIKQCDIALHAGDIMGAAPLNDLQPKLGHTIAVKGNNDAPSTWAPDEHDMLDDIPDMVELNLPGGILVMEHSHRMWDRDVEKIHQNLRTEHPDAQLIIYGHTHIRTIDDSAQPMIANPGAAGETRVHDGPSCLELTISADKWELQERFF